MGITRKDFLSGYIQYPNDPSLGISNIDYNEQGTAINLGLLAILPPVYTSIYRGSRRLESRVRKSYFASFRSIMGQGIDSVSRMRPKVPLDGYIEAGGLESSVVASELSNILNEVSDNGELTPEHYKRFREITDQQQSIHSHQYTSVRKGMGKIGFLDYLGKNQSFIEDFELADSIINERSVSVLEHSTVETKNPGISIDRLKPINSNRITSFAKEMHDAINNALAQNGPQNGRITRITEDKLRNVYNFEIVGTNGPIEVTIPTLKGSDRVNKILRRLASTGTQVNPLDLYQGGGFAINDIYFTGSKSGGRGQAVVPYFSEYIGADSIVTVEAKDEYFKRLGKVELAKLERTLSAGGSNDDIGNKIQKIMSKVFMFKGDAGATKSGAMTLDGSEAFSIVLRGNAARALSREKSLAHRRQNDALYRNASHDRGVKTRTDVRPNKRWEILDQYIRESETLVDSNTQFYYKTGNKTIPIPKGEYRFTPNASSASSASRTGGLVFTKRKQYGGSPAAVRYDRGLTLKGFRPSDVTPELDAFLIGKIGIGAEYFRYDITDIDYHLADIKRASRSKHFVDSSPARGRYGVSLIGFDDSSGIKAIPGLEYDQGIHIVESNMAEGSFISSVKSVGETTFVMRDAARKYDHIISFDQDGLRVTKTGEGLKHIEKLSSPVHIPDNKSLRTYKEKNATMFRLKRKFVSADSAGLNFISVTDSEARVLGIRKNLGGMKEAGGAYRIYFAADRESRGAKNRTYKILTPDNVAAITIGDKGAYYKNVAQGMSKKGISSMLSQETGNIQLALTMGHFIERGTELIFDTAIVKKGRVEALRAGMFYGILDNVFNGILAERKGSHKGILSSIKSQSIGKGIRKHIVIEDSRILKMVDSIINITLYGGKATPKQLKQGWAGMVIKNDFDKRSDIQVVLKNGVHLNESEMTKLITEKGQNLLTAMASDSKMGISIDQSIANSLESNLSQDEIEILKKRYGSDWARHIMYSGDNYRSSITKPIRSVVYRSTNSYVFNLRATNTVAAGSFSYDTKTPSSISLLRGAGGPNLGLPEMMFLYSENPTIARFYAEISKVKQRRKFLPKLVANELNLLAGKGGPEHRLMREYAERIAAKNTDEFVKGIGGLSFYVEEDNVNELDPLKLKEVKMTGKASELIDAVHKSISSVDRTTYGSEEKIRKIVTQTIRKTLYGTKKNASYFGAEQLDKVLQLFNRSKMINPLSPNEVGVTGLKLSETFINPIVAKDANVHADTIVRTGYIYMPKLTRDYFYASGDEATIELNGKRIPVSARMWTARGEAQDVLRMGQLEYTLRELQSNKSSSFENQHIILAMRNELARVAQNVIKRTAETTGKRSAGGAFKFVPQGAQMLRIKSSGNIWGNIVELLGKEAPLGSTLFVGEEYFTKMQKQFSPATRDITYQMARTARNMEGLLLPVLRAKRLYEMEGKSWISNEGLTTTNAAVFDTSEASIRHRKRRKELLKQRSNLGRLPRSDITEMRILKGLIYTKNDELSKRIGSEIDGTSWKTIQGSIKRMKLPSGVVHSPDSKLLAFMAKRNMMNIGQSFSFSNIKDSKLNSFSNMFKRNEGFYAQKGISSEFGAMLYESLNTDLNTYTSDTDRLNGTKRLNKALKANADYIADEIIKSSNGYSKKQVKSLLRKARIALNIKSDFVGHNNELIEELNSSRLLVVEIAKKIDETKVKKIEIQGQLDLMNTALGKTPGSQIKISDVSSQIRDISNHVKIITGKMENGDFITSEEMDKAFDATKRVLGTINGLNGIVGQKIDLAKKSLNNILEMKDLVLGEREHLKNIKGLLVDGKMIGNMMAAPFLTSEHQSGMFIKMFTKEWAESYKDPAKRKLAAEILTGLSGQNMAVDPTMSRILDQDFDGDQVRLYAHLIDRKWGGLEHGSLSADSLAQMMRGHQYTMDVSGSGIRSLRPVNYSSAVFLDMVHTGERNIKTLNLKNAMEWIDNEATKVIKAYAGIDMGSTRGTVWERKRLIDLLTKDVPKKARGGIGWQERYLKTVYFAQSWGTKLPEIPGFKIRDQIHISIDSNGKNDSYVTSRSKHSGGIVQKYLVDNGVMVVGDGELSPTLSKITEHSQKLEALIKNGFKEHANRAAEYKELLNKTSYEAIVGFNIQKQITPELYKYSLLTRALANSVAGVNVADMQNIIGDGFTHRNMNRESLKKMAESFSYLTSEIIGIQGKKGFPNIVNSVHQLYASLMEFGQEGGKEAHTKIRKLVNDFIEGKINAKITERQANEFRRTGFGTWMGLHNSGVEARLTGIRDYHTVKAMTLSKMLKNIEKGDTDFLSSLTRKVGRNVSGFESTENSNGLSGLDKKKIAAYMYKFTDLGKNSAESGALINKLYNDIVNVQLKDVVERMSPGANNLDQAELHSAIKGLALHSAETSSAISGTLSKLSKMDPSKGQVVADVFGISKKTGLLEGAKSLYSAIQSVEPQNINTNSFIKILEDVRQTEIQKGHKPNILNHVMRIMSDNHILKTYGSLTKGKGGSKIRRPSGEVNLKFIARKGTIPMLAIGAVGIIGISALAPKPAVGASSATIIDKNRESDFSLPKNTLSNYNSVATVKHVPEWIQAKIQKHRNEQTLYNLNFSRSTSRY